MPVRFIVGRAGSSKTWRCLEAVRARLREDPAGGSRPLLLVPEQASFQMERALIETPGIHGFIRCEVLSFQRLAYRILAETGAEPRRADQTIGPLGRMMAIRRLIRREKAQLRLLGRVADTPGLVKQVAAALEELWNRRVRRGSR
jgi:ATP-dependent helicase/nuclease subunit B